MGSLPLHCLNKHPHLAQLISAGHVISKHMSTMPLKASGQIVYGSQHMNQAHGTSSTAHCDKCLYAHTAHCRDG
jgi:hypothetical protein